MEYNSGKRKALLQCRLTRGLGSSEGLAAVVAHHGVDHDVVQGQRVEPLQHHRGLGPVHKHLRNNQ